jgi:twitching motility two-component system response regulator PilH
MPTVLIVDDSTYQRRILRACLEEAGYKVAEATNGREGVDMILSVKPDAALFDLLMPEMDGVTALKEISEKKIQLPIIIVSADIQETTKKTCMNLGAVGFVNKPVKGESLNSVLSILKSYIG